MTQYRFTPKSVVRFVPIFKLLCEQPTPQTISFSPTSLAISTETALSRLRDAANALIRGQVSHPDIDAELLATKWPLFKVTTSGQGNILIVPKAEKQTTNQVVAEVLVDQPSDVLAVVKSEDESVIRAFALLLGRRFLSGRVQILGETTLDLSGHDVEIITTEQGTFLF